MLYLFALEADLDATEGATARRGLARDEVAPRGHLGEVGQGLYSMWLIWAVTLAAGAT